LPPLERTANLDFGSHEFIVLLVLYALLYFLHTDTTVTV